MTSGRSAGSKPRISSSSYDSHKSGRRQNDGPRNNQLTLASPLISPTKKVIPSSRFTTRVKREASANSLSTSVSRGSLDSETGIPFSPASIKTPSVGDSINSPTPTQGRKKIVASGRAAVKRKPKIPSNLSQSHQSKIILTTGPRTSEVQQYSTMMSQESQVSISSHKSVSVTESMEDMQRKSVVSDIAESLSHSSLNEINISIVEPIVTNSNPALPAPPALVPIPSIRVAIEAEPVIAEPAKSPVVKTPRAAVPSSGRAAVPMGSRAAAPKKVVAAPNSEPTGSSNTTTLSEVSIKEKKGLFGFGRKK